jgi:hypothetical protein
MQPWAFLLSGESVCFFKFGSYSQILKLMQPTEVFNLILFL